MTSPSSASRRTKPTMQHVPTVRRYIPLPIARHLAAILEANGFASIARETEAEEATCMQVASSASVYRVAMDDYALTMVSASVVEAGSSTSQLAIKPATSSQPSCEV